MNQIRIETKPIPLKGPARDFETAVLSEQPHLSLNALYWFGQTAVKFHHRAGKIGITFYKPSKYGFEVTRITVNGLRQHAGFVDSPVG